MPRLMYDSVNPWAIPEHAQMVLVYVDGIYKWSQAGRDRFKYATQVTCSAVGAVSAQVGDVEEGCIWPPANAVPWVQRARRDGFDPTVYVNEMNDWGPVREAFRRAGVPEPHYWVANYNGVPAIPAGSIGRQYAHPSTPPGNPQGPWHTDGHWDESWIADYWPGVDSEAPGGGGGDEGELQMGDYLVRDPADGACYVVSIGSNIQSKWHVPNTEILGVVAEIMDVEGARDVSSFAAKYFSDEKGPGPVDVDEDAIAVRVSAGVVPMVLAAIRELGDDLDGLSFEETVGAVTEALRRGTGS